MSDTRTPDSPGFPMRDFVQWFFRVVQGLVVAVVLALAGWVWNAEGRITRQDLALAQASAEIAGVRATQDTMRDQATDIALIKLKVDLMGDQLAEIKQLVKERR